MFKELTTENVVNFVAVLCLVGKAPSGKHGCPFCSASSPYTDDGELYTLGNLLDLHRVQNISSDYKSTFLFCLEVCRKWESAFKAEAVPKCGE